MRTFPTKFNKMNKSGKGKPAQIVALQSNVFYVEQAEQSDWAACYDSFQVDWTPTPPNAGEVVLGQITDTRYEEQLSASGGWADFCTGVGGFNNQHWQSFRFSVGVPRKIRNIKLWMYNGLLTTFTTYAQLYTSGKSAVVGAEVAVDVAPTAGAWITFDFNSQNLILQDNTTYWVRFRVSGGTGLGFQMVAYAGEETYTSGQHDRYNGLDGWWYAQGDLTFQIAFTGQHGYFYQSWGLLVTQTMSLSSIPTENGEWVFDDIAPLGTRIEYQAYGCNSAGATYPGSWDFVGVIEDGDEITALRQFYRVTAMFYSNAYQDDTPVLNSVRADFSHYEKFTNRAGLGLPVVVQNVSNLSMSIDMFKGSTIGQIDIELAATDRIKKWIATSKPKNKMVKVLAGFVDDRQFIKKRNIITDSAYKFADQWETMGGAAVTVTQDQADPFGGASATRIQTSGGSTNPKYLLQVEWYNGDGQPTRVGSYYATSVWVKVLGGTSPLRIDDNVAPSAESNVTSDGQWHKIELVTEGNGSGYRYMRFDATSYEGQLDFLAWHPQCEYGSVTAYQNPAAVTSYNADLIANRFTEQDFIDYRWGQIDDYKLQDDIVTITMKDFSKEWDSVDIPSKWTSATDDIIWTGSNHCDVMKDIILNQIGVRDSKLEKDTFDAVKTELLTGVNSPYSVTHKITGNVVDAKTCIDELRLLTASFFIYKPTGKIALKRWDSAEAAAITLTDKDFISAHWEGNAGELYNRLHHYYGWIGSGDETKCYSAFYDTVNSTSMVEYQETATFLFKDQWTPSGFNGSVQVADFHNQVILRHKDPPALFFGELDRRWMDIEPGDMVNITSTRYIPSTNGLGVTGLKFQVINTELNFMDDRINLTMKEV